MIANALFLLVGAFWFGNADDGPIQFATEIFQGPFPGQFQLGPDGHIYAGDFGDRLVRVFDLSGKKVRSFGGRGQGPGKFARLAAFELTDENVFIIDPMSRTVQVFDHTGHWKTSYKVPFEAVVPPFTARKVATGWVFRTSNAVVLCNEQFVEFVALAGTYSSEPTSYAFGKPTEYNPARDRYLFTVDSTRTKVFYYEPGPRFEIKIYDVVKGRVVSTISHEVSRYAFHEETGVAKYEAYLAEFKKTKQNTTFSFPKFYPMITTFTVEPNGLLRVVDGSGFFAEQEHQANYFFDLEGNFVENPGTPLDRRVFAIKDGRIFQTVRIDDEFFIRITRQ